VGSEAIALLGASARIRRPARRRVTTESWPEIGQEPPDPLPELWVSRFFGRPDMARRQKVSAPFRGQGF
jgi:hypothetical protein